MRNTNNTLANEKPLAGWIAETSAVFDALRALGGAIRQDAIDTDVWRDEILFSDVASEIGALRAGISEQLDRLPREILSE